MMPSLLTSTLHSSVEGAGQSFVAKDWFFGSVTAFKIGVGVRGYGITQQKIATTVCVLSS